MSADQLHKAEARFERASRRAEELRQERNEAIRQHLADGYTHQWISDATGLSRGRISQIAKGGREASTDA